jgi:hypothetical protein
MPNMNDAICKREWPGPIELPSEPGPSSARTVNLFRSREQNPSKPLASVEARPTHRKIKNGVLFKCYWIDSDEWVRKNPQKMAVFCHCCGTHPLRSNHHDWIACTPDLEREAVVRSLVLRGTNIARTPTE